MNRILRALRSRILGDEGEALAARTLQRAGMRVILRNYETAHGEIDLIVRDGETLVFVEVKTRRRGSPAEAVDAEKQRRLTLAALHFLKTHRLLDVHSRFDVIAIVWTDSQAKPAVEHYRDAFPAVGRGQMFR